MLITVTVIKAIATYGNCYGRYNLSLGNKFKMNVCDIISEMKVRCAAEKYCEKKVVEQQMQVAGFLRRLLFKRDGRLVLTNNISFTCEEIKTCIDVLCTN